MDQGGVAVEGEDDGLVLGEERVVVLVGQAVRDAAVWVWSFIRSTTLTTRIFSSGSASRRMVTAARVSSVGVSPQQAMTTSGSCPWSLEAHCQMPMPWVQCLTACSMVSHWGRGCLEATMTLT